MEVVVTRYLQAKANTVQALAEELGVSRQWLHAKVREFLREHPEFTVRPATEGAA